MKRKLMWELEFNMVGNESSFYLVHQSDFENYIKYPYFSLRNKKLFNIRSLPNTNPPILEAEVLHTVIYNDKFVYILPDEIEF